MKSMKFKSNTKGKFNKIVGGNVFDSPLTFITELLQNAQRSKSSSLEVIIRDDILMFIDNGCGLKDIESLITFDCSQWKSTKEGFGLGFFSVFGIPELEYVKVRSNKFLLIIDMEAVKCDLEFDGSDNEDVFDGFLVELKSKYIEDNNSIIQERIKSEAERMLYKTYMNNQLIPQKDIFENISGDFVKKYENRYFEAILAVSNKSYSYPMAVYELRDVRTLYNHDYVSGVVSIKQNAVDLKEPDRKSIVYNKKYDRFNSKMEDCVKDLYKSFLQKIIEDDTLNEYSEAITKYLKTKDYEKFLLVDDYIEKDKAIKKIKTFFDVSSQGITNVSAKEITNTLTELTGKKEIWVLKSSDEETSDSVMKITSENIEEVVSDIESVTDIQIGSQVFKKVEVEPEMEVDVEDEVKNETEDNEVEVRNETENKVEVKSKDEKSISDKNEDIEKVELEKINESDYTGSYSIPIVKSSPKNNRQTLKDMIKKNRNIMWVEMCNSDSFTESIALAEYYDIKVLKAKNKLFETFLKENEVPHIKDIESAIFKDYSISEMDYKTSKEKSFITMLEPIRKHYELQKGVFKIGNICQQITVTLNGKNLKNEKQKNTSKKINVYAVQYRNEVIFDRKATNLKKFNICLSNDKSVIGKNELKCIMYNLNTVAHELAHLLYGTVDNTENHRKYERMLEKEIIDIYLKL